MIKPLEAFTITEIRLRISKVLKVYDLSVYKGKLFKDIAEIKQEGEKNLNEGIARK